MGIAKIVKQALGIEPPTTEEIVPAPTQSDLAAVPPQPQVAPVPDLMKQKELLEEKKKEIEADLAKVTGDMAKSDITPQPQKITGGVNMEDRKEEVKKEEEKKEDAKKEAAVVAPVAAEAAVEPPPLVTAEDKPKATASFGIRFVQGTSFDNSYFVAEDGKAFLAVKASRIIPKPVQDKIIHALATTKAAPVDVVTPTEIVDQLVGQGVNTLATFKAAMLELEANATEEAATPGTPATPAITPAVEGTEKTAGMMAWNESEVMKTKVKAGDAPVVAFMEETPSPKVPSGTSSKVKQFYGRLPASAAGGAAPANALNPNSAMMAKIDLLRRALEQAQAEAKDEKAKADLAIGDKNKMVKEKDDSEHSGLMESIVKDLVGKKLIDQKDEQAAIAALAKVEKKSLAQVAELLKLLGKGSKDMGPAPMPDAEKKPAPMFGAEKQPKISAAQVLPAFLNEKTETDIASAPSFMSKYWDAK